MHLLYRWLLIIRVCAPFCCDEFRETGKTDQQLLLLSPTESDTRVALVLSLLTDQITWSPLNPSSVYWVKQCGGKGSPAFKCWQWECSDKSPDLTLALFQQSLFKNANSHQFYSCASPALNLTQALPWIPKMPVTEAFFGAQLSFFKRADCYQPASVTNPTHATLWRRVSYFGLTWSFNRSRSLGNNKRSIFTDGTQSIHILLILLEISPTFCNLHLVKDLSMFCVMTQTKVWISLTHAKGHFTGLKVQSVR